MGGQTIKVVAFASLPSFFLQINKAGSWPIFESLKKSIMIAVKKNIYIYIIIIIIIIIIINKI